MSALFPQWLDVTDFPIFPHSAEIHSCLALDDAKSVTSQNCTFLFLEHMAQPVHTLILPRRK